MLILPVQSSAYSFRCRWVEPKRYWPCVTHRIRLAAVDAGSNAMPVSSRVAAVGGLDACDDLRRAERAVGVDREAEDPAVDGAGVELAVRADRDAGELLAGGGGERDLLEREATGRSAPPVVPVVKVELNGTNAAPAVSFTPSVTSNV